MHDLITEKLYAVLQDNYSYNLGFTFLDLSINSMITLHSPMYLLRPG